METLEKPAVQQSETALLVQGILREIMPGIVEAVRASNQLTPELVNELKKPYVDPVVEARNKRLFRDTQQELLQQQENKRAEQAACGKNGHKNKDGDVCISLITNEHTFVGDIKPRGVCLTCFKMIRPEGWEIAFNPDDKNGTPVRIPEDPEYHMVEAVFNKLMAADGNNYY